jgi:hypothetical protein
MKRMQRTSLGVCALVLVASAVDAQVTDHLECFKVRDTLKLAATVDLDVPPFGAQAGCKVSSTKLYCVRAAKSVVSATDRATGAQITPLPFSAAPTPDDRICYKLKCSAPATPIPNQQATDQFGSRTFARFKASMLCTPAVRSATFCGDGTIQAGEDCEGGNLGGASCASLGFSDGGTLACTADCRFDTSGCRCQAFPATGQVTCWDSAGNLIACAGTGHDGDVRAGAALAYADNGDGTITDVNTGLTWEKKSDDGSIHDQDDTYTWADAFAVHVAGLNTASFAGHTDWRVPNVKELQSIVDYELFNPSIHPVFDTGCMPGCDVLSCSCTLADYYWSSTTYAGSPSDAWTPYFYVGLVYADYKTTSHSVRAVRGGS